MTAVKTDTSRSCMVCGKTRIRRADGICSDCAPSYYGTAAVCQDCGDPTRAADRLCPDCRGNRIVAEENRNAQWYDAATGLPVPTPPHRLQPPLRTLPRR